MKTLRTFLLLLLLALPLKAQQETLLQGELESGGWGGPAIQLTSLNDATGILVGGGGGWIINHTFTIGGFGYGLVNNIRGIALPPDSSLYLNFGYGGVYLAYIHASDHLLHFTLSTLIGGGSLSFREHASNSGEVARNDSPDSFFLIEPGLDAEVNIAPTVRVAIGGNYRFVSGVELGELDNTKISGPSAHLIVKFGSF
jgi:hypothetical protein